MMNLIFWLLTRLTERSTWLGLISVASAAGAAINPALTESIVTTGVGAAGIVGIITKDKKQED